MSEAMDRAVLGDQAKAAWDQFINPYVSLIKADYMDKLIDLSSRPLDERARQGITNLSIALRVSEMFEGQLRKAIADGEAAKKEIGRASAIANMSPEARRYAGY